MSCNCLLVVINNTDILSATGNTLYTDNAVYVSGFNDCDSNPVNDIITEPGLICYCGMGIEPILCDMSGYSYDISSGPLAIIGPLTEETPTIPITVNLYYYQDDVQQVATYSSYVQTENTCSVGNDCCDNICTTSTYCISNTGNDEYDDTYNLVGLHNGYPYWLGETNGLYIYYSTDPAQWCLAMSLDGPCFLSGKSPCTSICPDFLSEYFSEGVCPIIPPTPTPPCDTFDFEAIFDCEDGLTPTPTPTPTITPTMTMTPSSTNYCGLVNVVATIVQSSPTPTPTPTMTPSSTSIIDRPCHFFGDASFNIVNEVLNCPISKQFQDCYNGTMYYTTNNVTNPTGGTITEFMVFNSTVDGLTKCISYIGTTTQVSGVNDIILVSGPYGYSNLGGCVTCNTTPTPTPTTTPTPTPSTTPPTL